MYLKQYRSKNRYTKKKYVEKGRIIRKKHIEEEYYNFQLKDIPRMIEYLKFHSIDIPIPECTLERFTVDEIILYLKKKEVWPEPCVECKIENFSKGDILNYVIYNQWEKEICPECKLENFPKRYIIRYIKEQQWEDDICQKCTLENFTKYEIIRYVNEKQWLQDICPPCATLNPTGLPMPTIQPTPYPTINCDLNSFSLKQISEYLRENYDLPNTSTTDTKMRFFVQNIRPNGRYFTIGIENFTIGPGELIIIQAINLQWLYSRNIKIQKIIPVKSNIALKEYQVEFRPNVLYLVKNIYKISEVEWTVLATENENDTRSYTFDNRWQNIFMLQSPFQLTIETDNDMQTFPDPHIEIEYLHIRPEPFIPIELR